MFCHHCGQRHSGGAFCPHCGQAIQTAAAAPEPLTSQTLGQSAAPAPVPPWDGRSGPPGTPPPPPPPPTPPRTGLSSGAIAAIVFGCVAVLGGLGFALFGLDSSSSERSESSGDNVSPVSAETFPAPGTNPELDRLWIACDNENYALCDDLYFSAPSGSDYENFGDSCGYRNEPAGLCATIYEGGAEPANLDGDYGSDASLDRLWDRCDDGNYQACDDLFTASPSGTAYRYFGDSCGLRNEPAGWCVGIYG